MLEPVVAWYSLSQVVLGPRGGARDLVFLAKLASARRLVEVAIALALTSASGWFWSEGYLAGPAGMAYLWFDGRKSGASRSTALLAGLLAAAIAIALSGGRSLAPRIFMDTPPRRRSIRSKDFSTLAKRFPKGIPGEPRG